MQRRTRSASRCAVQDKLVLMSSILPVGCISATCWHIGTPQVWSISALLALFQPLPAPPQTHPFQVWLASSLLADSLAVAAQTLLARSLAAGQQAASKVVVGATLRLSLVLGCGLAAGLAVGRDNVAALFSSDPAVLACLAAIMPFVVSAERQSRAQWQPPSPLE